MTDITILCKVVDNYGDIGVVYRLARSMYSLDNTIQLRIITDNLASFAQLAPEIDVNKKVQSFKTWKIFEWNAAEENLKAFTEEQPHVILECFQCGRPEWLETLLFTTGVPEMVHIINLDYLTAEPYADDFHCLASLTRSSRVQKVNFMPGFTNKTGGLILDRPFTDFSENENNSKTFSVLVFSYKRDFLPVVKALSSYDKELKISKQKSVFVNVASGLSEESFLSAWKKENKPFEVKNLPFLRQEKWDELLFSQSFLFIRGEESLSRACVSGIPFIWHAYVQDDNYQLVKVKALLDRMEPFFEKEAFKLLSDFSLAYNTPNAELPDFLTLLHFYDDLQKGFISFAKMLYNNGDLAAHLLSYIRQLKKNYKFVTL